MIAVDKARFLYLISQHPGFAVLVMETVSRWLRKKVDNPKITSSTTQLNDRACKGTRPAWSCQLEDGVWQLRTKSRSCNSYLFRGRHKTILVDAGLNAGFDALKECLNSIEVPPDAIDTIILTHEHFDHIGAVPRFTGCRVVAAHRLTAHKIASGDHYAILRGSFVGEVAADFGIEMILDEGAVIDTGDHQLRVFHTPGHASGAALVCSRSGGVCSLQGTWFLPGAILRTYFGSGSISDTIYSLDTLGALRAELHLPGHGPLSTEPARDIERALVTCRQLLSDTRTIFETLSGQEGIDEIILSLRDINR